VKHSLSQSTQLRQELRMNPRLYQAMDLLYMPLLDLQQHLKQELEVNPFLELAEADEDAAAQETAPDPERPDDEDESRWEDILLDGFGTPGGARDLGTPAEMPERMTVEVPGLADHLYDQLQMLVLDERDRMLADEIVGNIGEDGYLQATLNEVVDGVNAGLTEGSVPCAVADAERVLTVIHGLDPPGVAARDLRECLLIQLRVLDQKDALEYRLVAEAFDEVLQHRWTDLARRYGVDAKDVQDAADALARLDPKPGLQFLPADSEYVIPDLIVEKVDGEYKIFLNDTGTPRLRISPTYRAMAADKKQFTGEAREFVTQKLGAATWLVQAIEQRRQTMLKVMNFIVDRQREFFEKGIEYLKPLTLREVAEVIDMHESTVSRVTSQKYVQTPRGVFPLKFFFSSSLGTTTGEDASGRSVKALLGKLVGEEDPSAPLTDAQLVRLIEERGIQIARRTVAKYRDQLGILPARMRKRL
jgi:RNA polymerase sigma-54 factor